MKFGGKRQSSLCFLESGMVLCYTVHKSTAAEVSVRKKLRLAKKPSEGAAERLWQMQQNIS